MNVHLESMLERYPKLGPCRDEMVKAFEVIRDSYRAGGKLLICGNGGSAADSEHIAGELLKGFERKRPLAADARAKLPAPLAGSLQNGLPAIPLTGFLSLSTAFANDVKPELIFAQLAWGLGRAGDVLLGITTSGNSANVLYAVEAAKAREMRTVALTGEGGGKIAALADVTIKAPARRTCEVQEYHLPMYHCLCLMLEDEFFAGRE